MPSGAVGDTFGATTKILQTIAAQARTEIAAENELCQRSGLPAYPELREAWTMSESSMSASVDLDATLIDEICRLQPCF